MPDLKLWEVIGLVLAAGTTFAAILTGALAWWHDDGQDCHGRE